MIGSVLNRARDLLFGSRREASPPPPTPPMPTRAEVVALLRDRSRWPADFSWDFRDSFYCALGLMERAWPHVRSSDSRHGVNVEGPLRLTLQDADGIFLGANLEDNPYAGFLFGEVTPEMVADALESAPVAGE